MANGRPTGPFGERLTRLRKERGLTQTALAEAIGVSQRMIAYYEGETKRPPATKLAPIAKALGMTVDELLGVKRTPKPRNMRVLRVAEKLALLPPKDQAAVFRHIDALSKVAG